ncbi:MAG: hypothetical protein WC326_12910 [Candidatus Delongbacteria bacterium]
MNTALFAVTAACAAVAWYGHRTRIARALCEDRTLWRANLTRGLAEASQAIAQTSEAAAAALKLVAEAIQGTGEMGVLESSVLAERVAEGASLDTRAAQAPSVARALVMLQEIAAARELIRMMEPTGARDTTLQDDAIQHLDAATAAFLCTPRTN